MASDSAVSRLVFCRARQPGFRHAQVTRDTADPRTLLVEAVRDTFGYKGTHIGEVYDRMKSAVMEELRKGFRPEFLNRVDEIIVFHELAKDEVMQMVDLMTKRLTGQLEGQGLGIELTQAAKELLADKGYDPQLGARPLRRAIQRMIEDVLSEKILYKEFHAGEIIVVDTEDDPDRPGDQRLSFRGVEGFQPPSTVELAATGLEGTEPPAGTD